MKKLLANLIAKKIMILMTASKLVIPIVSLSTMFTACQKEAAFWSNMDQTNTSSNMTIAGNTSMKAAPSITWYSCGMSVNVFAPIENSSNLYSFAFTLAGQLKRFGIWGTAGKIDFNNIDKFSFEFAGYLDGAKTVKAWKIRRTDGKYLTTGLSYASKLTGVRETDQIFLLSSLGNNQYKILLPKLSTCNLAAIWDDIDLGYRISNFAYNDSRLAAKDTKITMTLVPLVNN